MARPKSIRNCDLCSDEYQYRPNAFARGMGRFCSKACSNSARPQPTELERFESYAHGVGVEPAHVPGIGPCTLWTGTISKDGYGVFSLSREDIQVQAHIYAWELQHGLIRDGSCVCHHCDVRACIRVEHLFLGTRAENNEDRHQKAREAKGAANGSVLHPERVPRGEAHGLAVLTEQDVREIRRLFAEGVPIGELAQRFDVVRGTIYQVVNRTTWRHVDE